MHEILLQQLIAFPTKAPSAHPLWLDYPQRLHELTEAEAQYLTTVLTESMEQLSALLVEEAGEPVAPKVMKEHLVRPFLYAFDKGLAIVYHLRIESDEPVSFTLDEIQDGAGDELPEYLQLKVTPVIPTVMTVFHETIDFAEQEATSSVGTEELFKSILTGAMFLGVELGLRMDLGDDHALRGLLEN